MPADAELPERARVLFDELVGAVAQLGVVVCVGVLLDTLVVRTLVVPALFAVVGDGMWWPSRTITDADATDARESDHDADRAPARAGV